MLRPISKTGTTRTPTPRSRRSPPIAAASDDDDVGPIPATSCDRSRPRVALQDGGSPVYQQECASTKWHAPAVECKWNYFPAIVDFTYFRPVVLPVVRRCPVVAGAGAGSAPRPTLAPTVAPVTGAITFSGLSLADAQASEDVLVDAIADSAGVDKWREHIHRRHDAPPPVGRRYCHVLHRHRHDCRRRRARHRYAVGPHRMPTPPSRPPRRSTASRRPSKPCGHGSNRRRARGRRARVRPAARGPLLATAVLGAAAAAL